MIFNFRGRIFFFLIYHLKYMNEINLKKSWSGFISSACISEVLTSHMKVNLETGKSNILVLSEKNHSLNIAKLTVKPCSEAKNFHESIANNIICICTISLYVRVTLINNFQTVWIYVYLSPQLRNLWFRKVDLKMYILKSWLKHRDHVIYNTVKKSC